MRSEQPRLPPLAVHGEHDLRPIPGTALRSIAMACWPLWTGVVLLLMGLCGSTVWVYDALTPSTSWTTKIDPLSAEASIDNPSPRASSARAPTSTSPPASSASCTFAAGSAGIRGALPSRSLPGRSRRLRRYPPDGSAGMAATPSRSAQIRRPGASRPSSSRRRRVIAVAGVCGAWAPCRDGL